MLTSRSSSKLSRMAKEPATEPRPSGRRPRGEMRERILDVALELFNEQGYEKTSLREIADRLGVTKAALYYHFERKDQILLELHLRLHALGREVLDQLDGLQDEREIVAAWPGLLDRFIEEVQGNRELFLLHERNRQAFERIVDTEQHRAENEDLEARIRRVLANDAVPLATRVRMAGSLGVIFVGLMGAGEMYGDVSADEVVEHVRRIVRDLFPAAT
jgi:AcrR family transcriptional regulator